MKIEVFVQIEFGANKLTGSRVSEYSACADRWKMGVDQI